ncbi:MAG: AAA family ATPase [Tyzzerella sp.]|nr:AAA family ATPase [Tyzzerella sp.]
MHKIKKITFNNHTILGNLSLDFCRGDGKAVDTVIIAGENGCGKSTILNAIYQIISGEPKFEASVEIEKDNESHILNYYFKNINGQNTIWVKDESGWNTIPGHPDFRQRYFFNGIFSDVDINFHASNISSVSSLSLDSDDTSYKSSGNFPKQIKQLIIDIQALDDAEVSKVCRENPDIPLSQLVTNERMPRFTKAFSRMFDGLIYSHIENMNGYKAILFKKNGIDIPIDNLSSGEKQIVYRGCFLLKNVNAMNGAFVFIDEPEISLHPTWQKKIMDYYKGIFTNENGLQTSQIFTVTHSPFIVHNENRKNDKVIVLTRNDAGDIVVNDKPEYFKCASQEAVRDAFSIHEFSTEESVVYLEGRTDERYFTKALQVFKYEVPFRFKWVGYIGDNGQEVNSGDKSVDRAFQFLVACNLPIINICLKDCDTNRKETIKNNVVALSIPRYDNAKKIQKGIENALVLDAVDLQPFYVKKTTIGDYGEKKEIEEFDKMAFCEAICNMDDGSLEIVFAHLKEVIDRIINFYNV